MTSSSPLPKLILVTEKNKMKLFSERNGYSIHSVVIRELAIVEQLKEIQNLAKCTCEKCNECLMKNKLQELIAELENKQ